MIIVDFETDDNWYWFMQHLKAIVLGIESAHLYLISILNYWGQFQASFQILIILIVIGIWSNLIVVISNKDLDVHSSLKNFTKLFYASTHKEF